VDLSLQDGHEEEHAFELVLHLVRKIDNGGLALMEQVSVVGREAHSASSIAECWRRLQYGQCLKGLRCRVERTRSSLCES
jgi:hypothetical protein